MIMARSKEQHCLEEKARYAANQPVMRVNRNAARLANVERRRQQARNWYAKHRTRVLAEKKPLTEAQKDRQREMKRAGHLMKKYGLTVDAFVSLLMAQAGRCGMCLRPIAEPKIAVDHDHQTQEVRGLLCIKCNMALGLLGDDRIDVLYNAIAYLHGVKQIA